MMRLLVILITILMSHIALAEWACSAGYKIPNENKLYFYECLPGKIKILSQLQDGFQIDVYPNIEFKIVQTHYPEGNTIWSAHSPDDKTAVVYIENAKLERNAWVIDIENRQVRLFTDHSEGKHFAVKFDGNDEFRIIHAGMGYRTNCFFKREGDVWVDSGCRKTDDPE